MVKVAVPPSSLMEVLSQATERIGKGLTVRVAWTGWLGTILGPIATAWMSTVYTEPLRVMVNWPLDPVIFFGVP